MTTNIAMPIIAQNVNHNSWFVMPQACSTKILKRKKPGNNFRIDYILWISLIMVRMKKKLSCEDTVLSFNGQHVKFCGAAPNSH